MKAIKRNLKKLALRFPAIYRYFARGFPGSIKYWEHRYSSGGNSGTGSYGILAEFKAEFLNNFVRKNKIHTVIEFGCGDGNQLRLAHYPCYLGLDVSPTAIRRCMQIFDDDKSKSFIIYDPKLFHDHQSFIAGDLALSLDVIYHLVEDQLFELHISHLFSCAKRNVIIYSSNFDDGFNRKNLDELHCRHRNFTKYVTAQFPDWELIEQVPNRFPFNTKLTTNTSLSQFFIYQRRCKNATS